jgi:glycosyltransferase involved in cell wall biosynthesis
MIASGPVALVSVVRIITRLNIGGPSIQAATLTERLTTRGFHTHLVHGRLGQGEGDMRYLLSADAHNVIHIPALQREVSPIHDVAALRLIYRLLCQVRPAIVHTHMAKAGAVGRTAALLYNRSAGRSRPARVLHTYHGHVLEGYFSMAKSAAFIRMERALARRTDRLIAISPRIREELITTYRIGKPDQYALIPLGFDLGQFAAIDGAARAASRRALAVADEAPVMSTVGRLTAIKQHELLLHAARDVVARRPDAVVLIAGDGERRSELEMLTRELGIAANVRWLGWRRDLTTIYGASDVFALTSKNEGTPVALIEAMASGVPGVSTDVGGVRDVIASDAVGVLAEADPVSIAGAVVRLLDDTARRQALGTAARAHVLARFTVERLVDDIDALYRSLL